MKNIDFFYLNKYYFLIRRERLAFFSAKDDEPKSATNLRGIRFGPGHAGCFNDTRREGESIPMDK